MELNTLKIMFCITYENVRYTLLTQYTHMWEAESWNARYSKCNVFA